MILKAVVGWHEQFLIDVRRKIVSLTGRGRAGLDEAIDRLSPHLKGPSVPPDLIPRDSWHSWDPTPWAHPWLTSANLRAARDFGNDFMAGVIAAYGSEPARGDRFGFVGNLANNMALRALPLRRRGVPITLFLHPGDRNLMSQPGWELSDAVLKTAETNTDRLAELGVTLPEVPDTMSLPAPDNAWPELLTLARETPADRWPPPTVPPFVNQLDVLAWPSYFAYLPALKELQSCSALFAAQTPYLAYLSGRPYLAAQTGGDLWFEASRNDTLGTLQRQSYAKASVILATNPWAYSNARRFGFHHVIYAPLIIDTDTYAPEPSADRAAWQAQVGGDFFALITARLDRKWKGSQVGLEGFARFAGRHPGARLVLIGWGEHSAELVTELDHRGLSGRYVCVPTSGKRKVVDYLRAADCVIDQFVIGYYGATALEAMSTGVPVVMRLAREQYDALCPTGAPPVLDAATAEETEAQLLRLASSPDDRARFAAESRQWALANHGVDVWRDRYTALLNAVAHGARFDFSGSPLAAPLTGEELDYHRAGLQAAPPFPQYDI